MRQHVRIFSTESTSMILQYAAHREEPGPGVQPFQFGPGEHGRWGVGPIRENLVDVGGPLQGAVVHQERNPIRATTMKWRQHW